MFVLLETRSSDKRPAKVRGSSLPREQSARLSKEFNDHDDSSSTTTESSNQDVEDKVSCDASKIIRRHAAHAVRN
jgi:hypothetical protein